MSPLLGQPPTRRNRLLIKQQVRLEVATTMDAQNSPCRTSSLGSRPSSIRQQSVPQRRYSQPMPPPTWAEQLALGPQLNPWHPDNPCRLERRGSIHDVYRARFEQRKREQEHYRERLQALRDRNRLLELRRKQHLALQQDELKSKGGSPSMSKSSSEKSLLRISSWKTLFKERIARKPRQGKGVGAK